jgi:succinate dehydrogenase/fumarate reductase flavoprotein subunit
MKKEIFDIAVVDAGAAGIRAAVKAGDRGLKTIIVILFDVKVDK